MKVSNLPVDNQMINELVTRFREVCRPALSKVVESKREAMKEANQRAEKA